MDHGPVSEVTEMFLEELVFYYSKLLNESTGTLEKYPPKIQAVRTFFAVLLQLFQVNGVLEN